MDTFWRLMPRLYYSTRKFLLNRGNKIGLKESMPRFLDYVYQHDGCIQREICDEFSSNASSVSKWLASLEKEGMICRRRNAESTREVNVFITGKGRETEKQMFEVYKEMDQIIFQDLSPEEREQCLSYLARLTDNMMSYKEEGY